MRSGKTQRRYVWAAAVAASLAVPMTGRGHEGLDAQIERRAEGLERCPAHASRYLERGDLYRLHGEWSNAIADLKTARQLDSSLVRTDLFLGKVYLDAGQPLLALGALDQFLKNQPGHVGGLVLRGRARTSLGQHLLAVENFTKAIAEIRAPKKPRPGFYLERARALVAAGEDHVSAALKSLHEGTRRLGPIASLRAYAAEISGKPQSPGTAPKAAVQLAAVKPDFLPQDFLRQGTLSNGVAVAAGPSIEAPIDAGTDVTRGPYLQLGTPTSIGIRWRTSTESESVVRFGIGAERLTESATDPTPTTEHIVSLSSLQPDTRYFYAVGTSSGTLTGGGVYSFLTAPERHTPKPTRIWVLGDSGTASENAIAVRNAYLGLNDGVRTDLWLMLGDNAYGTGTDRQYQTAVFEMYPEMLRTTVLWPTLGNHDGISADSATQTGPYYEIFTLPTLGEAGGLPSGTEAYYSFDHANIHFVCLDSHETSRKPDDAMLTWLHEDLEATTSAWKIAFWHHPPYSKCSHDSDRESQLVEMRENALPILEEAGVDLVLSGHSHSYERSFFLDGHYGKSQTLTDSMIVDDGDGRADGDGAYEKSTTPTHAGAVYVVAGSSGRLSGGQLNHPAMFLSLKSLGSLVLDISGDRLDARFLDATGMRGDHFTIVKTAPSSDPPIDAPPVAADDAPVSEVSHTGAVSGTLILTRQADGIYQTLQEVQTGERRTRRTLLEHTWRFNVTGGSSVVFYVKALRGRPRKGRERFVFSYSTDGVTFIEMLAVTKKQDGSTYQTFELPASVSGPVDVRVVDNKRKRRERSKNSLLIDHMFIRSSP